MDFTFFSFCLAELSRQTLSSAQLPARVAAAANPAAVYGSVPGGAALIIYGFGTKAAGAKPAEKTPAAVTNTVPLQPTFLASIIIFTSSKSHSLSVKIRTACTLEALKSRYVITEINTSVSSHQSFLTNPK